MAKPSPAAHKGPSRRLGELLLQIEAETDTAARLARDPVSIVREMADPVDAELVGLLASSLAFGNVTTILTKVRDVLRRLDGPVSTVCADPAAVRKRLAGFTHRLYRGADVAGLLIGGRRVQLEHGSMGDAFAAYKAADGLQEGLARLVDDVRRHGGLDTRATRGARHLLPDPRQGGSSKRLLLFLRWMVRPRDGTDVGLWSHLVSPAELLIPLDTHLFKLSKNVGLTTRSAPSWRAAEEVTAQLRRIDAGDPVRFDFPLCHLGMVGDCASRRDVVRCEGCGVRPLCVHWRLGGRRRLACRLLTPG